MDSRNHNCPICIYIYTYSIYIYINRMISNTWFLYFGVKSEWDLNLDPVEKLPNPQAVTFQRRTSHVVGFVGRKEFFFTKIHQFLPVSWAESSIDFIVKWYPYVFPHDANDSSTPCSSSMPCRSEPVRGEPRLPIHVSIDQPVLPLFFRFSWVPRAEKTRLNAKICGLVMKCPYLWLNKSGERRNWAVWIVEGKHVYGSN